MFGLNIGRLGLVGGATLSDEQRIQALSGMAAFYDFSDKSTLFQDSAGTLPVTAVGQPIGLVLDKSGKGNTLIQPTAINRLIYTQDANGKFGASCNGTNQWMQTAANLDLSGTDKLTVVTGVKRLSNVAGIVAELSVSVGNPGVFYLVAGSDAGLTGWSSLAKGSASATVILASKIATTLPDSSVITISHDIAGDMSTLRRNRVQGIDGTADKGAGNFGSYPLYVGSRAGNALFFNGNIHTLAIRGALSTQPEVDLLERFANSKIGAYTA